jgi:uncharacterized repeat protein (TIGR01451 family)
MMKKAFLTTFAALLFSLTSLAQSCLPGGIVMTTQAQVDSFAVLYPGCTEIAGNMTIGTNNSNITSLSALSGITSIGGFLYIFGNDSLESLSGLEQITSIGGYLKLSGNQSLSSLSGLSNLQSVDGYLQIDINNSLIDLTGLDQLSYLGGYLWIRNNNSLTSLHGLEGLSTIYGRLTVQMNGVLTSLSGLDNITQVFDYVDIIGNPSLVSLTGLNQLMSVGTDLYLQTNASLADITALSNIVSVPRHLVITSNYNLTSLAGIDNLVYVGGQFYFTANYLLEDLLPLQNLVHIGNTFFIGSNNALTSLDGLDNLAYVGGFLNISECALLESLEGLSQLDSIAGSLFISENPLLTNLSGLSNLDAVGGPIEIFDNPVLSECAIFAVCDKLLYDSDNVLIENNAPGCNTPLEVEQSCGAEEIQALVVLDQNGDCQADAGDTPVEAVQVRLSAATQNTLRATEADGIARFGYLDTGALALYLPQFPTANWAVCQDTVWLNPDTIAGPPQAALVLQSLSNCPELHVELGLPPFFRGCLVTTDMQVSTVNTGGATAEDVQVAVVLPLSVMEVIASTPPINAVVGDTLYFEVGDLPPFVTSYVNMTVRTLCDTFLLGQTICPEAYAEAGNFCPSIPIAFSEIRIQTECIGDTLVRFKLKNIGDAPTIAPHNYIIIEDEVVLMSDEFQLAPQEELVIEMPTDGSTFRMEATRLNTGELTAAAIENCGGLIPGLLTAFWLDQGGENYDFDCRMVNQAYDPNQKTAIPTGIGESHLLAANRPIQYTIEFQNTGADTAYRVQLIDVLSPYLDVNTFTPIYASHPYTWEIRSLDTLEVLFSPIALPDSNANEAASKGFFSYTINQLPDLPDGTLIENTAAIVFDFNPPIITNTTYHTIGELVVEVDEPQVYRQLWRVLGNPLRTSAVFAAQESIPGEKRFTILDAHGRLLRTEHFSGQEFYFHRGALPGGAYFFQIIDARGRMFTGKLIVAP